MIDIILRDDNDLDPPFSIKLTWYKIYNMTIIIMLISVSLLIAGGFLGAFFWAVRDGQFDDEVTPSMRILIEDDMIDQEKENELPINNLSV